MWRARGPSTDERGRAMPAPAGSLRWSARRRRSGLVAARGTLDGREVVALDLVDGEHLVRGVAELVEGDRATGALEVRRLHVAHHCLAALLAPVAALHRLRERLDDHVRR